MKSLFKKLIPFVLIIAVALCTAACNDGGKPEDAVKGLIGALKSMDMEKTAQYISSGSLTTVNMADLPDGDMVIEAAFTNLSVEIIEVQSAGDDAVVTAKISTLDLEAIMGQCTTLVMQELVMGKITDNDTDTRLEELFKETLALEGLPQHTTEVDINVKKIDGNWKVISDDAFQNAISGGFLGAVANAKGSMPVGE